MKLIYGILFTIFFFSCSEKEKPQGILPVKKTREILWDMIRADQYITEAAVRDTAFNRKTESIKLYEAIFQIHKTSREQFKKTMDYYAEHPNTLQPILDSIAKKKKEVFEPKPFKKDTSIKSLPGKFSAPQ